MPYINVKMLDENVTQEKRERLISGITDVFVNVLGREPKSVWVVIDEVPLETWGIGGQSVAKRNAASEPQK